ncbi:ACR074Wp [Eremothecium gossypii ATCC 10895]|uniref:Sorting nexin-4 n=1 Tax=Eremothecium gossypii (strain ATCC 10895 / CBS 109.51 / FGSC 9923 / NRRL Y-1056) TaxID=284811 RepID=SNX4_EREGS|nr:ACR074Wp [Eremothecium gossypii ATCC 10895]Q75C43.1 RecName: Full=Sorting nexin-4; AltName: Full=Autophagy-related protein 24 [Eremothecium gossypii ATCC 10895]AAS51300.1 ACR074Wp [Eremothecium gossypii ATCC 10895]AEY95592.1 FACR074Wp [Eremothecium gossypii FDAG1]
MSEIKLGDQWFIIVSDPQKQRGDKSSSGSYVTYQISSKPATEGDKRSGEDDITVVHRRYSDFVLLYQILANDYPACIVPPLPDKKVLNYLDRFSQSFTQKRCHSLQNFLQRLAQHPVLSQSKILHTFLVSSDWDAYQKSLAETVGNLSNKEELTETIMNAFKSVHSQSDEFVEIKEKSGKLDHNVSKIDKLFHRVVKKQEAIAEDYGKLGLSLRELQELVTTGDDRNSEVGNLGTKIKTFNEGMAQLSYSLRDLSRYIDYEYIIDLRDMEDYIDSMKQLIKLKDQKQIDYEELSDYLTRSINEKNNLISGYGSGSNFFKSKLEEFTGINQEAARREKISKLESKVQALTTEVENAKKVADAFEKEALKEVEIFEQIKTRELKRSLTTLADHHIEFYQKMVNTWSKIEESL